MAQSNRRSGSRSSTKKSQVRVSGKKRTAVWYRRWQTFAFVLAFGLAGSILLILTHATTPPNCELVTSPTGSTMQVCANITSSNMVNGQASYVGKQGSYRLSSGSVTLFQCDTTTLQCTAIASSNTIVKPNIFTPNKVYVKTTGVAYQANKIYKTCSTFADSTGWQQTNICTKLITFGTGYGDTPQVYTQPTTTAQTTTTTTTAAPNCGGTALKKADGSAWTCSFDEEFSGTSIDRTKWVPQVTATSAFTSGVDPYRACYMDSTNNISVSSGYLNLTLRKEAQPFTCAPGSAGAFTTSYTSGDLTSWHTFSQQYGRFEVSAKLPTTQAKGLQETLWLWPNNDTKYGKWPASGEFDFSEFYSMYSNLDVPIAHYNPTSSFSFSTHTNTYTPVYGYDSNYNNCYINYGAFNTYTATWQPGYLEVDVNGKPCLVDNYSSTVGPVPAPFDQPFFLALTQAIGIKVGNQDNSFDPAVTPLPATTQVDYVRVWK